MQRSFVAFLVALFVATSQSTSSSVAADQPIDGKAQQVLTQASSQQKYAFLLFYKEDTPATQLMAQALKSGLANRKEPAVTCVVLATDPAEKGVVERFGVSRTPMPLIVAVAPNGAITGIFSQRLTEANLAEAFVTPTMEFCMKSMQAGKLVLVCVNATPNAKTPNAVTEFQADPQFKDRVVVTSFQVTDPAETRLLEQMSIDPAKAVETTTVFLAPPGVIIGKYSPSATAAEMGAALHQAGKCCNDPNCKHNQASQAKQPSSTKRN